MKKKKKITAGFYLTTFVGAAVLVCIGVYLNSSTISQLLSHADTVPPVFGVSAIQPGQTTSAQISSGAQVITMSETQNYLNAHPFPLGPTVGGNASTISRMMFTTSAEASKLLQGESTGLPDTSIVMYVEEKGPFLFTHAGVPSGAPIPEYTYGIRVFDAITGNLILASGQN